MCGLVGIAGDLALKDEMAMKRLFLADYFRGPDSTGLAAIRKSGFVEIAKIAAGPIDLFGMAKFRSALSASSCKAFIGHNRAATKGAVNNVNAHPFEFGNIVGAHNGTLETSSWRALEDAVGETFEVDSMAIFAAIDKLGLEDTVKLLEGAWALTFYNKSDNTMNFLRNDKRPFWYAYSDDFKKLFWASEHWMISTATISSSPSDYKLFKEAKGNYTFFATEENVHYRFDLEALAKGGTTRPKAKAKLLKGKEPSPVIGGEDPFGRVSTGGITTGGTTTTMGGTSGSGVSSRRDSRNQPHVKNLVGSAENPLAGFMDREKFEHLTKCTCDYCGNNVQLDITPSFTYYEKDNLLLCEDCGPSEVNQVRIYPRNFFQTFSLNQ